MTKCGLVLEGGAMRGLFTAGALDVMLENGIAFDGAVGVSAGAVFGCNFKSKQAGRVLRYNLRFCKDPRFCSFRSLVKTGDLFGRQLCYHDIPYHLDPFDAEAYRQNPMEFYVVCTDVETGEAVYRRLDIGEGPDMPWFRASASMPLVSRVVETDGLRLLDGGIADSIPLAFFESIGYEKNVVILTQPEGYVKKPSKGMFLMRHALSKYPVVLRVMEKRHECYNSQRALAKEREKQGRAFVLCPQEKLCVSRVEHDPEKLRRAYDAGRAEAERRLAEMKAFLAAE